MRFGVGHALHPVHAGFEFQLGEGAAPAHLGDDFLVAAHGAFAGRDHLDLPALQIGEAFIHPEQVAGEQRGLVAAGAGADFQHDVAVIHGVLGQQRHADLLRQFEAAEAKRFALGCCHGAHLGFGRRIGEQRIDIRDLGVGGAVGLHRVDQRIEFGEFARDPHIVLGAELAQQLVLERGMVRQQDIKFGFRQHGWSQMRRGGRRRCSDRAPLQRQPLGLGEFRQLLADRHAARGRVEQRNHHCLGLFGVEVENQRLHRAMRGGRQ
ncbi:MAG TPA: hypothetical protein VII35_07055, partial [Steroidobacteraceae bacterium]